LKKKNTEKIMRLKILFKSIALRVFPTPRVLLRSVYEENRRGLKKAQTFGVFPTPKVFPYRVQDKNRRGCKDLNGYSSILTFGAFPTPYSFRKPARKNPRGLEDLKGYRVAVSKNPKTYHD
jgi:hypothetical protein